ncbi:MAG: dTDP-L-rhamnose 4-epimerase [Actinomycetota bacterium]|nr:dTDP-L-rhamnose 4-epimerase [Actinomycetota bacterium]
MRVIVTGAAGFIGSHVAEEVTRLGHDVVALDGLIPEVHPHGVWPTGRADHCQRVTVDLRDTGAVTDVIAGADAVIHQASLVGHGLDLADLPRYAGLNDLGTASLLAAMHTAHIGRLVLASSMVVYGEGRYTCPEHGVTEPLPRTTVNLARGEFEPECPGCRAPLVWRPVPESAQLRPTSAYAASKVSQEHFVSVWARSTGVAAFALRYHNVYGPRMPLNSPYSGVVALFRSRVVAGRPPLVFEDGEQMRDFVHVHDIARANALALGNETELAPGLHPVNICSGDPRSVGWAAGLLASAADAPTPIVTGEYRAADVRHVVADPTRARQLLGFEATISPESGLAAFGQESAAGE